jgi:hypothetical protein
MRSCLAMVGHTCNPTWKMQAGDLKFKASLG